MDLFNNPVGCFTSHTMCGGIIEMKHANYFMPGMAVVLFILGLAVSGCTTDGTVLLHDGDGNTAGTVERRPSFSYGLLEMMVKLRGYKKTYSGDPETLGARSRESTNRGHVPPKAFYRRFLVTETTIEGRPCFFIAPKQNARSDTAVFFLHGGGFMFGIASWSWDTIERIVAELMMPVCVPFYPIYPETNPDTIIAFVDQAFTGFCATYPEARIIGLGDSAGSCLLLSFCHYLTMTDAPRFPDLLICVSPAQLVGIDEATLNEMRAIDKEDVSISIAILENVPVLFNLRDDDLNWFSAPLQGDFSRFPPLVVFSGTHEIFYPLMKPFVERVRSQGKSIDLYAGYGMMHSWPFLPVEAE
jgi:acetyl esterase/lipase